MSIAPRPLDVLVLHNCDYSGAPVDVTGHASGADVENVAQEIACALASRGHRARTQGIDARDLFRAVAEIAADPPGLVFNLCESLGRDARNEPVLPSLLDLAGIPYTGSGPLSLGLALRKDRAKDLLRGRGVPTPEAVTLATCDVSSVTLPFPLIVKPTREDASIGIDRASVVRDRAALAAAVERVVVGLAQPALVERYVEGREMYVSLLGNPPVALPFHEIDFADLPDGCPRIVTYAGKWDPGSPEFHGTRPVRCLLDEATRFSVEQAARAAFAALELRDYARIDVRLAGDGTPYVIDVNPNCDLSGSAGFARAAGFAGLDHATLVERVCRAALERSTHVQHSGAHATDRVSFSFGDPGAAARAERSSAARTADRAGRPVLVGGGRVRAGAHRRRAH